jgi:hypothetical protein
MNKKERKQNRNTKKEGAKRKMEGMKEENNKQNWKEIGL